MKYLVEVIIIIYFLYDSSYFGKIINILQILQGGCKLLTSTGLSFEVMVQNVFSTGKNNNNNNKM